MTKEIKLPKACLMSDTVKKSLPYNGNAVSEKGFSFSFACFDRSHVLFNLGDNTGDGTVGGKWFLELLDCLKSVSNMTFSEVQASMHDMHRIDWAKANATPPKSGEQYEYWQFRINKSKGRVIGLLIEHVFYIVWLDAHHNLTDSEGYGKTRMYSKPLSVYETQESKINELLVKIKELEEENTIYKELFEEQASK